MKKLFTQGHRISLELTSVEEQILGLILIPSTCSQSSLIAQSVKNLPAMQETWVQFLRREDPLEKEMATTPVFLPGESHRQRNLVGYSPWGHKSRI